MKIPENDYSAKMVCKRSFYIASIYYVNAPCLAYPFTYLLENRSILENGSTCQGSRWQQGLAQWLSRYSLLNYSYIIGYGLCVCHSSLPLFAMDLCSTNALMSFASR